MHPALLHAPIPLSKRLLLNPVTPLSLPFVSSEKLLCRPLSLLPKFIIQSQSGESSTPCSHGLITNYQQTSPLFIIPENATPFKRSEAIYEYSMRGTAVRTWNCQISAPPSFPPNFDPGTCSGSHVKKAIVVWRGRQPGVYGN